MLYHGIRGPAAAATTILFLYISKGSFPLCNAAATFLPVSSPHFGGCSIRSASTIDPAYCALKPSDCTPIPNSPYTYIPPHLIRSTTKCRNPHEVTIGRCTSSIDGYRCSAFSESCGISAKFLQSSDETCGVVRTSDTDVLTHYPQCSVLPGSDRPKGRRCVLHSDDCVEGEIFEKTDHLPWLDPCYCYDVPTGMCHLKGVSPITAGASFCAVGGYDCPDGYDWMTSAMLLNMIDPPRSCLLCQEESVAGKQLHESVVESGGCYANGTSFLRCALESSECDVDAGELFMSSEQVYEMGHVPCSTDDLAGGECTSGLDTVECTNRAESCKFPPKFVPRDSCTMHSDRATDDGDYTWFGRCRTSHTVADHRWCVWGSAECDAGKGETWYPAELDRNWLDGCNCENVQTGGCRHDGGGAGNKGYYCAVSKLGCDDPTSYVSSGVLLEQVGLDCRLCQPRRKVIMPIPSPEAVKTAPDDVMGEMQQAENSGRSVPIGLIITLSIAMLLGLSLFAVRVFKQSTKKKSSDDGNERGDGDEIPNADGEVL